MIHKQLRRLGASADWQRERFTMDDGLSAAVIKTFVQMHREGLIYRDKRLVNWDPKLMTAISDLEVEQIEQKSSMWHIRYGLKALKMNIFLLPQRVLKQCLAMALLRLILKMNAISI